MTESFASSPCTHECSAGNAFFDSLTIVVDRLGGKITFIKTPKGLTHECKMQD